MCTHFAGIESEFPSNSNSGCVKFDVLKNGQVQISRKETAGVYTVDRYTEFRVMTPGGRGLNKPKRIRTLQVTYGPSRRLYRSAGASLCSI